MQDVVAQERVGAVVEERDRETARERLDDEHVARARAEPRVPSEREPALPRGGEEVDDERADGEPRVDGAVGLEARAAGAVVALDHRRPRATREREHGRLHHDGRAQHPNDERRPRLRFVFCHGLASLHHPVTPCAQLPVPVDALLEDALLDDALLDDALLDEALLDEALLDDDVPALQPLAVGSHLQGTHAEPCGSRIQPAP